LLAGGGGGRIGLCNCDPLAADTRTSFEALRLLASGDSHAADVTAGKLLEVIWRHGLAGAKVLLRKGLGLTLCTHSVCWRGRSHGALERCHNKTEGSK